MTSTTPVEPAASSPEPAGRSVAPGDAPSGERQPERDAAAVQGPTGSEPTASEPTGPEPTGRRGDTRAPAASRRVPLRLAGPLAVIAGLALDAAFPALGAWSLAFVGVAALLVLVRDQRLLAGYGLGVLFGLGFFVPHVQWSGIYVGPLPWIALATLQALLLGLVGPLWVAAWRVARRALWTLPLAAPLAWMAVEAFRARWPFGGFAWGRLGFSQADSPLLGLVAVGGVPVLGAGVVAVGTALAIVAVHLLDRWPDRRHRHRDRDRGPVRRPVATWLTALVAMAVVAVLAPLGSYASRAAAESDATVRVGAIQGNVPQPGLDFNAERRAVLDNHATTTTALARSVSAGETAPVDVVVWPENSSDIDPLRNADADEVISRATDAIDAPVLVGAVLREPGENLTNAVLVWEPGSGYRGDEEGRYAKQEPAPFAEYIPYRDFFRTFSPFVDEVRDFVPGPGPAVLDVGGAAIGPVICFEVAEDHVVRGQVDAGADILAIPTNNATFGFTDESVQQLAMSRVRAVEHGRSVVHISTVGVSTLVLPDGRTGERTELFTQDLLVGDLPLATGTTPAAVAGEWPELAAALAAVALLVAAVRLPAHGSRGPSDTDGGTGRDGGSGSSGGGET